MVTVIGSAEVGGRLVDVVLDGGLVVAVLPAGSAPRHSGHLWLDAAGGALLPGLHDHHLHLLAMAAAAGSVDVGPSAVAGGDGLGTALAGAPGDGWVRAIGYHESVAGLLSAADLDRWVPGRPVRVQHRSGALWMLNTAALDRLGVATWPEAGVERSSTGEPTGRLFGLDAELRARRGPEALDLAPVGRQLAAFGITGVTDATPTTSAGDLDRLARAVRATELACAVVVTGAPDLVAVDGLRLGPAKLYPADHALPGPDEVAEWMRRARRHGRAVAVHCVSRAGLAVALAAWETVGVEPGDRVEHGALVPVAVAADLAARGITVVTQPSFVRERGDRYLADVDERDQPDLWRCGSLLAAGVRVGGSSDAPYGSADPWAATVTAVDRRTAAGRVLGDSDRIDPVRALELYLAPLDEPGGAPRRVQVGAPADLCLLDVSLTAALGDLSASHVRATLQGGAVVYERS